MDNFFLLNHNAQRVILIFLSLFTFYTASSQVEFTPHFVAGGSNYIDGDLVFVTDFNSDGLPDVLTANETAVNWFQNIDNSTTFIRKEVDQNLSNISAIYAVDINGNGNNDIIVATQGDSKVRWYENLDGQGNFSSSSIISEEGSGLLSVIAIDLDNDNDVDIILASKDDDTLSWYKNLDGNGSFGTQQLISLNSDGVTDIASEDIDNDGDNDIVIAEEFANAIVWFENLDGLGNFSNRLVIENTIIAPKSVQIVDLDNDNFLDLLIASNINVNFGNISWIKNLDGMGNFNSLEVLSSSAPDAKHAFAYNIRGGLNKDILFVHENRLKWILNYGNGSFSNTMNIDNDTPSAAMVAAGDFDEDGTVDVILGAPTGATWYKNQDGQGNFGREITISLYALEPSGLALNDYDEDNDLDIAVLTSHFEDQQRGISIFLNKSEYDGFSNPIRINNLQDFSYLLSNDYNGDNRMDFLFMSYSGANSNKKFSWSRNQPEPEVFTHPILVTANPDDFYRFQDSDDIDGDGDVDVLLTLGDKVVWFENFSGIADFSGPREVHDTTNALGRSLLADIDQDLDLDVVSRMDSFQVWYENIDGQGNFGSAKIIVDNNGSSTYALEDLDGDGDLDYITRIGTNLLWFENEDGLGNFGDEQIIVSHEFIINVSDIKLGDLDNDGDLDVLTSGYAGFLWWYENNGQGSFGSEQVIQIGEMDNPSGLRNIEIGDIDQDGDLDFAAIYDIQSKVMWYENTIILSAEDHNASNFVIYPNPTNQSFNIQSNETITSVTIFNYLGQQTHSLNNSKGISQVNIQNLNKGIYIVRLTNSLGTRSIKKLVKN